jgi:Domain of unknown function (DUF5916)/Carbohydrate family 9 binding domain-like
MGRFFGFITALLLFALIPGVANPQQLAGGDGYRIHIRKMDAKIHVDGKLDEPVWKEIEPITNFRQTQPVEGVPVSERTEARIFYDDNNIYFGFKLYDSARPTYRLVARDTSSGSDSIDILLDTFHDRRTGYWFSITAAGVQWDGTVDESRGAGFRNTDMSWDGIWYSATSMEEWGWSAEMVLPFKSIRISQAASQEWGINIAREIMRRNEFAYWVPVPRYEQGMKPSRAGTLTLENIKVGRNLELVPFVRAANRSGGAQSELNNFSGTGGLDLRYGLKANLTANLAVNPDFGETEADEFTSEISRFEIFFPEKRKFFTEGTNYFQTPMDLFFTRRIGAPLPDGEPQRILQGGKITGKTGPWTIGALEAITQPTDFLDPFTQTSQKAPAAFFGVLRVQHALGQKSAFGLMSVNRRQGVGDVGQNESTDALDLSILSGQHIRWNSQVMVNLNDANPGVNGQHLGWLSDFVYDSDQFAAEVAGKFLGREVDLSHTGFEPETDRWSGDISTTWKPYINRYGIRQLFFNLNYDGSQGTRGELEDAGADGDFQVQFKNFWQAHFRYSYDRTRFFEFSPDLQRFAGTRVYQTPRFQVEMSTNEARNFSFGVLYQTNKMVQFNENFYGFEKLLQVRSTVRFGRHLRWELSGVHIDESLRSRVHFQYRRFLISRWTYQFNHKLRTRVLAQYASDRHGHNLSVNSLVAYDFTSRSALFVGYNRQRRSPLDPVDLGNQVFVKLSYLFAF